MQVTEANKNL